MIPPWTNRIRHPMQSLRFSNEIRDADRANLLLENSFAKGRFEVEIPITSHGGPHKKARFRIAVRSSRIQNCVLLPKFLTAK
jgi:hypothetical protein